jgi:hypothetical protein
MKNILLAASILAAVGVTPARAGVTLITDFTVDAVGVSSVPADNLSAAVLISAARWTAAEVIDPLGGLAPGDVVTLTNPFSTAIGAFITISWDGGAFHDTTQTSNVSFVGDELDIAGNGTLFGPGVPAGTKGVLDLSFTQAGGAGDLISGSGSFVASNAIPEPSTWMMMIAGFGILGFFGTHKSRKALRSA